MPRTARPSLRVPTACAGIGLVEVAAVMTVLVIGVMGFVSALISGQVLAVKTREVDRANAAAIRALESFRAACSTDFTAAVTAVATVPQQSVPGLGSQAIMTRTLIQNETLVAPPIDLNGDGDKLDTAVALGDLVVAVVVFELEWRSAAGATRIDYTTIRPRGSR